MPCSTTDPPQDFNYPAVRINHALSTLDLNTLMMRSKTNPPEALGSSLDDSTYELLGESSLETSDDEAHTESIASTDGPTPDDASDFSDDDNDYELGHRELHNSTTSSHPGASEHRPAAHPAPNGEDSTLTEVPAYTDRSDRPWSFKLDEQPTQDPDVTQGSKVARCLPDQISELPQALSHYGSAHVRLVIKAALSQRYLPTPDTYRILYIGAPEQWQEREITTQIGAALTASPNISKSVVVRGQIEPYGPVIQTYRCVELHAFAEHDKLSHVLVILDDEQQLKFGPGIGSTAMDRPDLVIFFHPTVPDTKDMQEFASASNVFDREGIPCLDLTQIRPYGQGALAYDSKTLRVCVEGRDESDTDYELKEVLILDHYTFSQLEPSQVNRHLALLSPHLMTAPDTRQTESRSKPLIEHFYKAFKQMAGWRWSLLKSIATALILLTLIPIMYPNIAWIPLVDIEAKSPIMSQPHSPSSTISLMVPTSKTQMPVPAVPSVRSVLSDLTLVSPQAQTRKCKLGKKVGKVEVFSIYKTGSHQFLLNPSEGYTNGRKKPQLQIQIALESQAIPARFNQTLSGDYIVDLEQEYPFSTFNVSIATHSKPLLRQSFEIMLGHNKSTLEHLLDTAKSNLIRTRRNLWDVSSIAAQQVRKGLNDLEVAASVWTGESRGSSGKITQHLRDAKHVLEEQLATGNELFKEMFGRTWMNLRQVTAPVRTSSPMLKARMNALRLRCNVEIATGMSGRQTNEKQTWACSKVRTER